MSGLMAKATFYFPLFEEKLDLYDVPLEMKYLAIVESALRPKAKSPVGATGLWQFMYGTGKMYGLEVSSYIDERQDPVRSTEAAARHLSDLYDVFEDWDLALAAYNSGSGNVTKAIRRAGGKRNYWNLRHYLPRETANYVPIFYATLYLFEYGASHGLYPDDSMQYQLYEIDSLQVKKTITFEQIQKATGIDISLLEFLNPSYKLDIIPYSSDKPNYMVLPREYIGLFVQNEDLIYAYVEQENAKREKPLPENLKVNPDAIVYRVKSGDYLGKIAERYGVSVRSIMRWNGLKSSRLRVGQKLKIYSRRAPSSTSSKKSKKVSNPPQGSLIYYTVQNGDTLWDIAQKYSNVSVDDIKKWNNLTSHNLKVGSKLKIYKS
jgi:membrane-bound lytic murein transglycosylase D